MTDYNNLLFSSLSHANDYDEAADLIYMTDPYIYTDLFGSLIQAKKVLAVAFDSVESVFYRENVFILKDTNYRVIGIALYHTNKAVWVPEDELSCYAKAKVLPPPSFYAVSNYMQKTYSNRKVGSSICNVAVHPDFRNRGLGSVMLKRLLSMFDESLIELTVLCDNTPAVRLYERLGFKIIGEAYSDYGGYNMPPVMCYKMVLNR